MSDSILVAYATRYGSTQEVAETVAAALRERGLVVEVQPMRKVQGLGSYRAVVLGAPLYIFKLHSDARRFLARHRQALAARPLAMFALGPIHDDAKEIRDARALLDTELAKFPGLKPAVVEVFAGRYDPAKLRFPDSFLAKLPPSPLYGVTANDGRNWEAIRAWAGDLAAKL
jgi:menaquinone-dependent protoporphyrinogen oxidase